MRKIVAECFGRIRKCEEYMENSAESYVSGSYTANLLGSIRSHLAGLQGYDIMALELIQNADDAKAESVAFDITDQGLFVTNSGKFAYCGDLPRRPCPFIENKGFSCDYHRIIDFASGGKLLQGGDNIGRFGIGFVSTYQVTDHPEIRSSGIKLTLLPEKESWRVEPFQQDQGTTFFLPWADNPNNEARRVLGVSHIGQEHIERMVEDFQKVLRHSLLFLRHIKKAEVKRNGKLLLACELDRGNESDLIVTFHPREEVEQWHILRTDVTEQAAVLSERYPHLASLKRSTTISIGLRIDPEPLSEGLIYAFLPTEQSTGVPVHINADFFPEPDRKSVIFKGLQYQQHWNEMLVGAAAEELAREPETLLKVLGKERFWELIGKAYEVHSKITDYPVCFRRFWERLKATCTLASIAPAQDGSLQLPGALLLPKSTLSDAQAKAILEIGGRLVAEELRPYHTAINQLGAQILTLERMVGLLEPAMARIRAGESTVRKTEVEGVYRPLWDVVNELLPEASVSTTSTQNAIKRLVQVPFLVTEDLYVVTPAQSYLAPPPLDAARVALLLPRQAIAAKETFSTPRLARLIAKLDLAAVASHLRAECEGQAAENVIAVGRQELQDLYALFAELDRQGNTDKSVYAELRGLPIWLSGRGLIKASEALLPGDFTDPTGQADLLEVSVLTEAALGFVSSKLGVPTQTIEAFVKNVVPRFFTKDGPADITKYPRLISELAAHPVLLNNEETRRLLASLPIVPTQDGGWSSPSYVYRRSDDLVKVLGDATHLWLDTRRVPSVRSVQSFIDSLGLRRTPIAQHLVERMLSIAANSSPTEDARRSSGEAFYYLCDRYEEWKERSDFQSAIDQLRYEECFPAEGDKEEWHSPEELYAPYRAEAFRSQAKILDFRNTARLKTELLEELDVRINPETSLVIEHLRHCQELGAQPHVSVYQVLNERAQKSDPLISDLAGTRCIYVESKKAFVRTNQLYWMPQQLGRFAFTIPGNMEGFKPLFTALGVKNSPDGQDLVEILLDIITEHFEQATAVTGSDKAVYELCLVGIAAADDRGELDEEQVQRLQNSPSVLNLLGQPTHPDEALLRDSEWHSTFFEGELNNALCKPAPETWPLLEKIGVKRLSECTEVALEYVDGDEQPEPQIATTLLERVDIVVRLLQDQPAAIRQRIRRALGQLQAVSYDVVRIQASVQVGDDWVSASPTEAHAFYDAEGHKLILARPLGSRSWAQVLNAILHQLMPEQSGSEIARLTLSIRPLMAMSIEDAHLELTDAGVPYLEQGGESEIDSQLASSTLDDIGGATEAEEPNPGEPDRQPATERDPRRDPARRAGRNISDAGASPSKGGAPRTDEQRDASTPDNSDTGNSPSGSPFGGINGKSPGDKARGRTPRPKHKEQWDRRLLSYVRKRQEGANDDESQDSPSEHNLAVEVVARAAVCAYEKARGRLAEQMAQTHPGYDIISRNPVTGEERFIEVKGVNGEWNQTGVGLSRLQFSNAQDYGERYWLYVVEFVSDPDHTRIHPIQSPATQVTSFMFDGNWRDAVTEEGADPVLAFVPGARVKHETYGMGEIKSIQARGSSRVLTINFDGSGVRMVTLNLQAMTVVEEEDGCTDT